MVLKSGDGRWLATLRRQGGGLSGRPVEWQVYWSLRYSDQEARRFRCRHEAVAWVRAVEHRLERAAPAPAREMDAISI